MLLLWLWLCCYNEAMSPSGSRVPATLTIGLLLAFLLLLALGGVFWASAGGLLSGSTPTPSTTPYASPTATPDFRATRTAEDILTQVAYSTQLATLGIQPSVTAVAIIATETPQPSDVNVPVVIQPDGTATAFAMAQAAAAQAAAEATARAQGAVAQQPDSLLATPTAPSADVSLPVIEGGGVPTAVAAPTEIPTAVAVVPPTSTALPPTEIPTLAPQLPTPEPPTATFTPVVAPPLVVNSMSALIDRQNGLVRLGPSSLYTQTGTIAIGTQVTLLARDSTGEWLYVCCAPNTNNPGWMRGVSARPTLNPTLPAPQTTTEANDIRWLSVRGPDAGLTPVPVSAPPAPGDFPMARRDAGNTGRVAALPRLPLQLGWAAGSQAGLAGGSYTSGAIVVGGSVIAASADGHLYSFDRESGSQRWRFYIGETVRATPLADGGLIFVVTESGRLYALEDQGNQVAQRWAETLNVQPRGMVAAAGRILLTARAADGEKLLIIDRGNGATLRTVSVGSAAAQIPAVGGQTVYVASDIVRAIDIFAGDVVWQSGDVRSFTTPPIFSSPGVAALAELYVADANGLLFAFDANTGSVIWTTPVGAAATGIAANSGAVFASGQGFVRAFARARRDEGQLLWSVGIAGNVPGGALVDDTRVFVGTDGGAFQYLDVVTGALLQGNVQSTVLGGAVAVAGPWIFAPAQSGILFAARE